MSNNTNLFTGRIFKFILVAILFTAVAPAAAQAQGSASVPVWMATSAESGPLVGRGFGRLTIVGNMLAYQSPRFQWSLPLSEIKRVAPSKAMSNALEVESVTGAVYYVSILNGQLMATSPGKAAQVIQRAVQTAPAPIQSRPTMVAAGGGPF